MDHHLPGSRVGGSTAVVSAVVCVVISAVVSAVVSVVISVVVSAVVLGEITEATQKSGPTIHCSLPTTSNQF